ncbi:FAD dependent oxidoreductase [Drechmeria coniospora]|uniref:FAD dependent oxidoreductase n=1 Tax=Drechmeria coniospora TaxID=98403 RepID=A0A151GTT4_DRECN|nr:FAD dependent oxidoreductase [Drechmeria coniospora]KYK60490.1 FAD dependent oxidoreductase [Drechmeria coniospora]
MTGISTQDGQAELPSPNSTRSYWLRHPSEKLLGHRTTEKLPLTADVVVVGSGITGAFAARELVAGGRSVLMLEAREACWGATGRNGGHCQPGVWNTSPSIARFELATFHLIRDLVAEHDIACDWQIVGGVHAFFNQQLLDAAKARIERLKRHPDLRDKAALVVDRRDLADRLRVPEALGAVFQPNAAKCWPYKLVAWVLERLLDDDGGQLAFNLQTNTPVTHLQKVGASWIVHTPRGQLAARQVLLASNGYTSFLLPRMTGLIVPVRGQICALRPPQGAELLPHSHVWLASGSDHYLVDRGDKGVHGDADLNYGPLILGGARFAAPGGEEGVSRDDSINPRISRALRRGLHHAVKLLPGAGSDPEELEASSEWTGIMGYSRDNQPWVGRVPCSLSGAEDGDDGLWISAGYTGHGMPRAARCGIAVAEQMMGKEGGVEVPIEWLVTDERAEEARTMALPRTVEDGIARIPL